MQTLLPLIPAGATPINEIVHVHRDEQRWTYYVSWLPVYAHDAGDDDHFRLIIAQLVDSAACRMCEIMRTFGLTKNKVIRATRQLRERGARSFFQKRRTRKGGTVLIPSKLAEAQRMLDRGTTREETASELEVKPDTLRKAINDGRLIGPSSTLPMADATTMSERSFLDYDAAQGMGTACTRPAERLYAAIGLSAGAPTRFEACLDVPHGGVLCALPALLSNGLLSGMDKLGEVRGYYTTTQILLVLSFMYLCRVQTVERLRGFAPGELGKLLGLDRIPEARCLRSKMDTLAGDTNADEWAAHLARTWLDRSLESPGFLYVDGHVQVYHGDEKLPRRYVSRERLCLRGISNYWVNDALGQPFFVVERQIDDGLLQTLRRDIVPRLLKDVPRQPTAEELEADPYLCRFVIVFDREGYSPAFFKEMWQEHRIACMTYRKNCTDNWGLQEFEQTKVTMPGGETVSMALAERGSLIGTGEDALWVKEIRKLTDSGHQTAIITTAYRMDGTVIAPHMFTRWCQENFFAYATHHFPLDLLAEHGREPFCGTERLVNPAWRELEKRRSSAQGKLDRRRAKFVAMDGEVSAACDHPEHRKWELRKGKVLEDIQQLQSETQKLAGEKKKIPQHITWDELPPEHKFMKLPSSRRRLINTLAMIVYRAETAMATLMCDSNDKLTMSDARAILQDLYVTPADLLPHPETSTMEVRVHGASTPVVNRRLASLFEQLNQTETAYPGTDLTMVFLPLGYAASPPDEGTAKSSER